MMHKDVRYRLVCDSCHKHGLFYSGEQEAAKAATGWWVGRWEGGGLDVHLCPACASDVRPDWIPSDMELMPLNPSRSAQR